MLIGFALITGLIFANNSNPLNAPEDVPIIPEPEPTVPDPEPEIIPPEPEPEPTPQPEPTTPEPESVKGTFPIVFYDHYLAEDSVFGIVVDGKSYWVLKPNMDYFWESQLIYNEIDSNSSIYLEGVFGYNDAEEDYEVVTSVFEIAPPIPP